MEVKIFRPTKIEKQGCFSILLKLPNFYSVKKKRRLVSGKLFVFLSKSVIGFLPAIVERVNSQIYIVIHSNSSYPDSSDTCTSLNWAQTSEVG